MRILIWSTTASLEYEKNIGYLLDEWSEKEALNFINDVEAILSDLKAGVVEYPLTTEVNIRKCVVCKQVTLFYQINKDDNIELLRFWNTYQDNKKLSL